MAADTRFAGFTLTAQVGLIPLGPDPTTGLEEFAHLATGAAPARRPEDGSLIRGPEHGVVLVLVPGGEAELGCLALAEGRQQGDAYVDVGARPCDLGLLPASFEPFLLSKYELTQSQWARHEGSNPAYYQFGDESVPPMRPVEQISWVDCVRVLGELDLALPTEDQWEYAARAGTTSSWPFGDERSAAALHCNLSDSVAKATWKNPQFGYEGWMDDGFADPAPVGSYLPNAFGLHDVIGNVKEWTSSPWSWPEEKFVKRKDDRDPATCATRVTRGGSFGTTMVFARVAGRSGYAPSVGSYQVGVRPMRALRAPD